MTMSSYKTLKKADDGLFPFFPIDFRVSSLCLQARWPLANPAGKLPFSSLPRLASLSCFGDTRVSLWKWSRLEKRNWTQTWQGNARDIYLVSLEKRRQERWEGKTASKLVQKRLLASSWKGENKQHFSGLNKKRAKASFIGPIRVTACGRQCWVLIWVLTKIFAGLRKPMT